MTNITNPDNLTGEQIKELRKLNLLDKGMRDKRTNSPVISSRKIAGPVKGVLRNTFVVSGAENDKKDILPKKGKDKRSFFSIKDKPKPPKPEKREPGKQKEMIPLAKGGRAMYKSGTRGCKLAMKGKGRAYGKNS